MTDAPSPATMIVSGLLSFWVPGGAVIGKPVPGGEVEIDLAYFRCGSANPRVRVTMVAATSDGVYCIHIPEEDMRQFVRREEANG
jgi:hypothetical protein